MMMHADGKPLVLVLEDEALIGITLQDDLEEAGYQVAGPFMNCAAALGWLRAGTPHAAILDASLKDGSCAEVASELDRRNVPFLIYSGHREDHPLLTEFPHVTWIEKPAASPVLLEACRQLLAGQAASGGRSHRFCVNR